ncbi:MAG: lactonase family protein, partial [Oscillospiraceae bacterium]
LRAGSGPVAGRQQSAHSHSATLAPNKAVLCVCDLGTDELACYTIKRESGRLVEKPGWGLALPPGSGPRHMVFAPNGENAYLLSELSRQVFHLRYSGQTGFSLAQAVSLPETNPHPSREVGAAALRITQDGRFLYASNRGDDSIVCIKLLPGGGLGKAVRYEAGGQHPRDFVLCNEDGYLVCACRFSGSLTLFSRNTQNGSLLLLDTLKGFDEPVCMLEVPG